MEKDSLHMYMYTSCSSSPGEWRSRVYMYMHSMQTITEPVILELLPRAIARMGKLPGHNMGMCSVECMPKGVRYMCGYFNCC